MTAALLPPQPLDNMPLLMAQADLVRQHSTPSLNSSRSHRSSGSRSVVSLRSAASVRFSERSAASGASGKCPQCAAMGIRICEKCTAKGPSRSAGRSSLSQKQTSKLEAEEMSPEASELLACLREKQVDLAEVSAILKESKSAANAREPMFGWAPILFAAHIGDTKLMSLLLEASANVNVTCHQGNSALHLAARRGHLNETSLLLSRGADIEGKNAQGWTPLMWSAIAGCPSVAWSLLDHAADPGSADSAGRTACMWAARHGHVDILRSLLPLGMDLSLRDEEGFTVKDHASYYAEVQSKLVPATSELHSSMEDGNALYWATSQGSLDLQRLLMQHGAGRARTRTEGDRDEDEDEGPEAAVKAVEQAMMRSDQLLAAARRNDWEAAEEALRGGACASTKGESDFYPALMWAAIHDAPAAAMSLVGAYADLEAADALGWTALHHAVHSGNPQMVAVLHYLGADFSVVTEEGDTAQHIAALSDAGDMLQLLAPATPDWNVRDTAGLTPLQVAATRGNISALRSLLALRADANILNERQQSPFVIGAVQGHKGVVQALVDSTEPLPVLWEEDDLKKMLDKLPWVDSDVTEEAGFGRHEGKSSNSSVCSGSTRTSLASVRNDRLGRAAAKRIASSSRPGMHTIKETDSEAGSILSTKRERPRSASSTGSHRSRATQRSEKSKAASVHSAAKSVLSHGSASKSVHSHATLQSQSSALKSNHSHVTSQSKAGSVHSKISMSHSQLSGVSRSSGRSRLTRGGKSVASRRSSVPSTIYSNARTVIDRSPVSLMNAACKRSGGPQMPPQITIASALAAEDKCGCKVLALAVQARHSELVRLLLEWQASPNSPDLRGNTALMLAASAGEKDSILLLLDARALADAQNADGRQALDLAVGTEVRQILQEHVDRSTVSKRMSKSCSLPSIVKAPKPQVGNAVVDKKSGCRLRVDGLPVRSAADDLEKELHEMLRRHRISRPFDVEIVVDPITLLSRGHGFLLYSSREKAEEAEEELDELDDTLRFSIAPDV